MFDEKKLDENEDVELNEETIKDLDADNAEGVVGGANKPQANDATTNSCECIS